MGRKKQPRLNDSFYSKYLGHNVNDLKVLEQFARRKSKPVVWLAGDSTLDNKFWLLECDKMAKRAPQNLKPVFERKSYCRADVAYWMNTMNRDRITINTAVEEATIGRKKKSLNDSDLFIQEYIREDDTLIVSIGGNDVAHDANLATVLSLFIIVLLTPMLLWPYLTWTPPMIHLDHLFRRDYQKYVEKLISKTKPKKVILCTVYYPDMVAKRTGWASEALQWLRYDTNPRRLHRFIDMMHDKCTSKIIMPGTQVEYIPLSLTLNGTATKHYVQRVEPSVMGGKQIARTFSRYLK